MYRYEWKKLLKNRFVTVFFCALLILNGILSFTAAKNTDLVSSKDVATAIQAYERDPVAWEEEYQALADYNDQFVEQQYEKMDAFIPQYPGDVFEWEYTEEALRYLVYRDAKLHLDSKDSKSCSASTAVIPCPDTISPTLSSLSIYVSQDNSLRTCASRSFL